MINGLLGFLCLPSVYQVLLETRRGVVSDDITNP